MGEGGGERRHGAYRPLAQDAHDRHAVCDRHSVDGEVRHCARAGACGAQGALVGASCEARGEPFADGCGAGGAAVLPVLYQRA